MSFIWEQIFWGAILPAVVMGGVLFIGGVVAGNKSSFTSLNAHNWAVSVGFGLAFGAAYLGTVGVPNFWPSNAMHWLFYMALVAAGVGVVEGSVSLKGWLRTALRLGLALVSFRLALGFMVAHHWEGASAWVWLGGLAAGSAVLSDILGRAAAERSGAMVPLAMTLVAAAGAAVLVLTGSARIGQLMGGLSAASAATLVVSWRWPTLRVSGGATVFGLLFSALLGYGYFTSADIPAFGDALHHPQTLATLLVAAAPLMLGVLDQIPLNFASRGRTTLAGAALLILPLGGALFVAATPEEPPAKEYKLQGFDYESAYK